MKVYSDVLGSVSTNCYYAVNEETNECVIIDPAGEVSKIEYRLKNKNLTPVAILLTHGHFDHILATDRLRDEYKIKVYAGKEEKEVLESTELNLSVSFGTSFVTHADEYLEDETELTLAGITFVCKHTPGHTKGGMSYYVKDAGCVFSGDSLFYMSVGRTDFPTGDMKVLINSIKEKLMVLPGDTLVYPGHGISTTVEDEKEKNEWLSYGGLS